MRGIFGKQNQLIIIKVPFSEQHKSLEDANGVHYRLRTVQGIMQFKNTKGVAQKRMIILKKKY